MTSVKADIDSVRCLWKLSRLCYLLLLQIANTSSLRSLFSASFTLTDMVISGLLHPVAQRMLGCPDS